jgi:hypothetical protein
LAYTYAKAGAGIIVFIIIAGAANYLLDEVAGRYETNYPQYYTGSLYNFMVRYWNFILVVLLTGVLVYVITISQKPKRLGFR